MDTVPATPPELLTDRLILRLGTTADIPAILRFFTGNREFLAPYLPSQPPEHHQPSEWEKRLAGDRERFNKDEALRLFIFSKTDDARVIGSVNYSGIRRGPLQHCTLGYILAENEQGKGYATEAVRAANDYVFSTLNLHRIMANYMPRNQSSGSLLIPISNQ